MCARHECPKDREGMREQALRYLPLMMGQGVLSLTRGSVLSRQACPVLHLLAIAKAYGREKWKTLIRQYSDDPRPRSHPQYSTSHPLLIDKPLNSHLPLGKLQTILLNLHRLRDHIKGLEN